MHELGKYRLVFRLYERMIEMFNPWVVGGLLIAFFILTPVVAVVVIALSPAENIWPHLIATVLPRYLANTIFMMIGVSFLSFLFGTVTAWLVVMYRFPGHKILEYSLLFPMAIPSYIVAYSMVDFLQYAGPVQSALRGMMGWQDARDYYFPEVRSVHMALVVFSAAFYPYIYLMARSAFKEQSGASYEIARSLGCNAWQMFFRFALPVARPGIFAGMAVVMMETVADYGTVSYFNVQTLTTGLFSVWFERGNVGGAAQIACVILLAMFMLTGLERIERSRSRFYHHGRSNCPITSEKLKGWRGWMAFLCCAFPVTLGFVLPVMVMLANGLRKPQAWISTGLLQAFENTFFISFFAALVTICAVLFLSYATRVGSVFVSRVLFPLTGLGYAVPGAVLAVGVLLPLTFIDHHLANIILIFSGGDPGLLLTGTSLALIMAYSIRFFGVGQNVVESAFGRVAPVLSDAARSLGKTPYRTLFGVYLPLMRGTIFAALLIVFVDCVKELPATLLLRPFGYDTLATRVFEQATLEHLDQAAPAALIVMAVGLFAVFLLARHHRL